MKPDLRLPAELAALREIRRRASRHCAECTPQNYQATLVELKQALAWMEKLEQEAAASRRYELLPPPNVSDRGE
jgi:hypothetical protein